MDFPKKDCFAKQKHRVPGTCNYFDVTIISMTKQLFSVASYENQMVSHKTGF